MNKQDKKEIMNLIKYKKMLGDTRMKIQRKRWVIIRDENEIFCGLARQFTFKPIDNIGDTSIKTYSSKAKAEAGFRNSHCRGILEKNWKAIEVTETIESEAI